MSLIDFANDEEKRQVEESRKKVAQMEKPYRDEIKRHRALMRKLSSRWQGRKRSADLKEQQNE